jgi:asparagine synthase (glutamine-hydrolysing)
MIAAFVSLPGNAAAVRARLATLAPFARAACDDGGGRELWASAPAVLEANGGCRAHLGEPPLPSVGIAVERGEALVVTRGGFGGRPAYVRVLRDVALASTDLPWILEASARLGIATSLDADMLAARAAHLVASPSGDTRSLFADVVTVPPGTRLEVTPRGHVSRAALDVPSPIEAPPRLALALREILLRAVGRAARRGERIGVLSGGGLDSGALLALAHHEGADVNAFALAFGGAGDDRPHLRALATHLGIEPISMSPGEADVPASLAAAGLPLTWPSGAAEATLLARARAWGAERVLCGLFADDCFDGDPGSAAALVRSAGLRAAISLARRYDDATLVDGARRVLFPWARSSLPVLARRLLRRVSRRGRRPATRPFDGPRLARLRRETWERAWELHDDARDGDAATAETRLRSAFFSAHLGFASELRMQEESLSGVLRLDPYLDPEVATFALSLPPHLLLGDGPRRGLFREALVGLLPESVRVRRDKASFAEVHGSLFRAPLAALVLTHRRFEALADLGIVEPRVAERALERASHEESFARAHGAELYAFVAAEAFARRHRT